jgi:hypothetical protein
LMTAFYFNYSYKFEAIALKLHRYFYRWAALSGIHPGG